MTDDGSEPTIDWEELANMWEGIHEEAHAALMDWKAIPVGEEIGLFEGSLLEGVRMLAARMNQLESSRVGELKLQLDDALHAEESLKKRVAELEAEVARLEECAQAASRCAIAQATREA